MQASVIDDPPRRPWTLGWIFALLHGTLSLACQLSGIVGRAADKHDSWDWFWQVIPIEDLLSRPWATILHIHYQPPGYSLWGLFLLKLAGPGHFPEAIRFANVLLGMLIVLLTWRLALVVTRKRKLAFVAGLYTALNPALFMYEVYIIYEMLVAALLILSAWCLWQSLASAMLPRGKSWPWLMGLVLSLNYLVMTRSLFHWFFLWVALAFAWPAWRRIKPAQRIAWLLIAIAIPGLWYAKNQREYGFFGASSWFGLGFFKCLSVQYTYGELKALENEGVIPHYVMERAPYQHTPMQYREFGFNKTSDLPTFNRDDFRNVNMVEIARGYEQASKKMILRDPRPYLRAMEDAYTIFAEPPSAFGQLGAFHRGLPGMVAWVDEELFYGRLISDQIDIFLGVNFGSLFYFYFPLLIAFASVWSLRYWKRSAMGGHAQAPLDRARAIVMAYFVFVSIYVAVVGCMFEIGENMRFRFGIEPFTLIITLILLAALARRSPLKLKTIKPQSGASLPPDPASFRKSPAP